MDEMKTFALQESKRIGSCEYQRHYHLTLLVTVEQEDAIVSLFKQRNWVFVKAGHQETNVNLRRVCEKTSGVSHESGSIDKVIPTDYNCQLENNRKELTDDTNVFSSMQSWNHPTAENSYIKCKVENDTETDTRISNGDLIQEVRNVSCADTQPHVVGSSSQMKTDNHAGKAADISSKVIKESAHPILVSCLLKSNVDNTFHPQYSASQAVTKIASSVAISSDSTIHPLYSTGQAMTQRASSVTVSSDTNIHQFYSASQALTKIASSVATSENRNVVHAIRCKHCEKTFSNKAQFESHIEIGKCQWVCKQCTKVFDYSKYKTAKDSHYYLVFKDNVERHKKECDCNCKLCGYSSAEKTRFLRHMKLRHSKNHNSYTCDVCFITFSTENKVLIHKATNHTGEAGIFRCPACPKEYPLLETLRMHLKLNHLKHKKRPEVVCSVCGKKGDIYWLQQHEKTHKETKDVKCNKCPKAFNSEYGLKLHQRRHNKDYSHYCEACGKGFYNASTLQNHHRIHTGEKPFSCSHCDYSCTFKVNLRKHVKTHAKSSGK